MTTFTTTNAGSKTVVALIDGALVTHSYTFGLSFFAELTTFAVFSKKSLASVGVGKPHVLHWINAPG